MIVIAGELGGDTVFVKEFAGMARVLRGDKIDALERLDGTQGDVFEIADRGGDDVKHRRRARSS